MSSCQCVLFLPHVLLRSPTATAPASSPSTLLLKEQLESPASTMFDTSCSHKLLSVQHSHPSLQVFVNRAAIDAPSQALTPRPEHAPVQLQQPASLRAGPQLPVPFGVVVSDTQSTAMLETERTWLPQPQRAAAAARGSGNIAQLQAADDRYRTAVYGRTTPNHPPPPPLFFRVTYCWRWGYSFIQYISDSTQTRRVCLTQLQLYFVGGSCKPQLKVPPAAAVSTRIHFPLSQFVMLQFVTFFDVLHCIRPRACAAVPLLHGHPLQIRQNCSSMDATTPMT
jgi:hypothetical protein